MNKHTTSILLAASLAVVPCTASADEAPVYFSFADGNLVLGFQATAGTGASQNVFFDLGPATAMRDNGNQGVLGNIGETLTLVYGANWHTREDLWFGIIANLNSQPASGFGSRPAVDGDPSRTFYISAAAITPGAGALVPAGTYSSTALGSAGTKFGGLENLLLGIDNGWNPNDPDPLARGLLVESDGSGILDQTLPQHNVAWQNGWTQWNPTPGAAFEIFTGGIQQNFSGSASQKHVDLQRILITNTGANPTGVVGGGTYVTTISVSSTGEISAATAGGSGGDSPFEQWIASFPELVNSPDPAHREADGDFDNDGIPNIQEFAFGGSPVSPSDNGISLIQTIDATGDSQPDLTLTVEVRAGATFSPLGNKLTASHDGVTYLIEGSLDLSSFDSEVSEVIPHLGTGTPKSGYVFKTFRLNASSGLSGNGFLRAGVMLD